MACEVERRVTITKLRDMVRKVEDEADSNLRCVHCGSRVQDTKSEGLLEDLAPVLRDVLRLLDAP